MATRPSDRNARLTVMGLTWQAWAIVFIEDRFWASRGPIGFIELI